MVELKKKGGGVEMTTQCFWYLFVGVPKPEAMNLNIPGQQIFRKIF